MAVRHIVHGILRCRTEILTGLAFLGAGALTLDLAWLSIALSHKAAFSQQVLLPHLILCAAIASGIMLLIAWLGAFGPLRDLRRMQSALKAMPEIQIPSFDQAKPAYRAVPDLCRHLHDTAQTLRDQLDDEQKRATSYKALVRTSIQEVERMAEHHTRTVVSEVADETSAIAQHSSGLDDLSQTVEGQMQSVSAETEDLRTTGHEIRSATETLTTELQEVQSQIQDIAGTIREAVGMAETVDSLETRASETTQAIESILALIMDVSEKTNLLALNATIEAARAGDAGKGFAVVAQEVKGLAQQTRSNAQTVSDQLQTVQSIVRDGLAAMRAMAGDIQRIQDKSARIEQSISTQTQVAEAIARSTDTNTHSLESIAGKVGAVTGEARTLCTTTDSIKQASQQLDANVHQLSNFIQGMITTTCQTVLGRSAIRYDVGPLTCRVEQSGKQLECQLTNLSSTGCFLSCPPDSLDPDGAVIIHFTFEGARLAATAEIRRPVEDGYGMAFQSALDDQLFDGLGDGMSGEDDEIELF